MEVELQAYGSLSMRPMSSLTPFRLSEKHYKARSDPSLSAKKRKAVFRPNLQDVFDPRRLLPGGPRLDDLERAGWSKAGRERVECFSVGKQGVKAWAVRGMPGMCAF